MNTQPLNDIADRAGLLIITRPARRSFQLLTLTAALLLGLLIGMLL